MAFTNSSLISYTKISPNKTSPRNHAIDTITIHCFVGQVTAQSGCNAKNFVNYDGKNGASCNYVVGHDGSVGLCVDEKDRSLCSSNATNDHRAITIEVASDTTAPYKVTDKALSSLIELCVDICKRNGIEKLVWSTNKNDRVNHLNGCNMTVHRDFANKSCPGDYLYNKHGYIADEVNKLLGSYVNSTVTSPNVNTSTATTYTVVKGDTLSKIGTKTGIAWKTIADINEIKSPYTINVGQVLKLKNDSVVSSTYTYTQFIKDVQLAIGAKVDGIAGSETLSKTVTVSKSKNNKHAVVKTIQKYLYAIGYTSIGTADGIAGPKFDTAVKTFQKDNGCVIDGIITAKNMTWKKLLKLA